MKQTIARLAGRKTLRVAGLMSGTSADGISAAITEIGPRGVRVLAFGTFPYPPALRAEIFRLFQPATSRVDDICRMNFRLGEAFAAALIRLAKKSRVPLGSIDLIGSHGQTIYHSPPGSTLQIGEPCVIAERTGITTVADFRPRDMAAGGQGAPLVPLADCLMFAHPTKSRAVQNIGGIANVTFLPAGLPSTAHRLPPTAYRLAAFDTGPGNMIIDRLTWHATGGRKTFDAGGRLAALGIIDARLLAELMNHPFLSRKPPKSTGREEFGAQFADALWRRARKERIRPADLVATATAFTARSIAEAYERFLKAPVDEVVVCGGGARNRTLLQMLRAELPAAARLVPPEKLGVGSQAREAAAFAVLAWATVNGFAGNVPAATGARRAVVLGKIVPG